MTETEAAHRLAAADDRIAKAAALAKRKRDDVTLIAVTKAHPAEAIMPLIAAGHRVFGENRVQETEAKWPELRETTSGIALHLIGALQSNKADQAVALFDAIHTLDRSSLVTALAGAIQAQGRSPLLFVQVNIGDESQKGGCAVTALPGLLTEANNAGLPIEGLMCIPPADLEPAPYFALLANLARDHGLPLLSMGMSGDFDTATMIGATHVRVGTALFGPR